MSERGDPPSRLSLALRPDVVRRALRTALLVGSVLIAINHGDAIVAGDVGGGRVLKMVLTFAVPYLVSTAASVGALRSLAAYADRGDRDV